MNAPVHKPIAPDVLDRLKSALGTDGWSQDPDRLAPKLDEWRGRWRGTTPLLLLPDTVEKTSAAVGICFEAGVPITPQGGNTGLVAGQIPQGEVLLSTEKLNRVREVNTLDDVIVAEAGVTLLGVQQAAAAADRFFPLSLAAEGTATIGGNISTNAGGTGVLRYGVTRALVLGLEAVLPNGDIYRGLKRLRKDNTGYDLKQLLIGAEGTLGVVTAASLKLFPVLASRATAMAAVASPADSVELLTRAKIVSGGQVEAFELIGRQGVLNAVKNVPGVRDPLDGGHPWYVLIEMASATTGAAETALERVLGQALDSGLVRDAAIAQSQAQRAAFWKLREEQSAAQKAEGIAWKFDVALPISRVADFIAQADAAVAAMSPQARTVAFGHVGDGNIHYDVLQPPGDGRAFDAQRDAGSRMVHDIVNALEGSISAEHGLGAIKTGAAMLYKSPAELAALRAIRAALDPKRIMNPRVLF